ncbi:MAG: SMC-Scp complex subunit ScpB [Oscillospiraceae bacterium]
METREMKEIEAAVEGILFASGEPVHIDRICLAAELDRPTAELVLQKLMDYYSFERRGMRLRVWRTAGSCAPPGVCRRYPSGL